MRTCSTCEYFDGGGRDKHGNPIERHGDCHNPASPRFETKAEDTCPAYYPDTVLFPTRPAA